jgi:protein TonB
MNNAPSFAALGEKNSGGSGVQKKILIAAVIVLALAALGYFGYGKFGKSSPLKSAVQPVSAPRSLGQPTPALAPAPSPVAAPSTTTPGRASSATQSSVPETAAVAPRDKPSAAAGSSPVIRIAASVPANSAANSEPATKKTEAAPLLVKSNAAETKTPAPAEEPAPPAPGPLAEASANDNNLSSLISTASPNMPKPALATVKVSQGVSQGLLIKKVQPQYPQAALAVHAQGAVQIEATINKEGSVTNLKVLSGDPVLARAALDAVRQWRYKPYYLDGEPVEIQTQITVNFKTD